MLKRFAALFLVVLLSINSFAAIVSDNDGGAFVTKQEFEELKTSFAKQIDNYNASIDSKIDGAIANYLDGVRVQKEEKITNLYQLLGGKKIRFGKPDIAPTINPVSGHALFFENCDRYGVNVVDRGRYAMMGDSPDTFWSTGGGTKGQFIKYTADGSNKCLYSYYVGSAAACYSGGWWTSGDSRTCVQKYPFGDSAQTLGAPIISPTSNRSYVDSYVSIYREVKYQETVLEYWTCSGSIDTTNNKILLSTDNFQKLDSRMWTASNATGTTNYGHSASQIQINYIYIYSWNTETSSKYDQLIPGFYYRTQYSNPLYGGVQLFEAERNGEIKIKKLRFLKYLSGTLTSGDVYFAINDEPFSNTDDYFGNVKIIENDKSADTTEITGSDGETYKYKVKTGQDMVIKFECKKNKTYYIKCQLDRTITKSNTNYVSINDGSEVWAIYD